MVSRKESSSMSEPLNAVCFKQAHWRVIAQGFKVEEWFQDGQAVGTGGIVMPHEEKLRVGLRHYRFTSSTSPKEAQLGGGWWIDFENYHTIESFAQEHGYDLGYAARLFLALPYSWTRVNRLVSAILEVPLAAYSGRGKPATEKRGNWTPIQHLPVRQFYIPGLFVKGLKPEQQLYRKAFPTHTAREIGNRVG
jgi:hypothetical protein